MRISIDLTLAQATDLTVIAKFKGQSRKKMIERLLIEFANKFNSMPDGIPRHVWTKNGKPIFEPDIELLNPKI